MSYITNIIGETKNNTNFRKVLFTGNKSQLVVMEIPVGGEIGEESHEHVEQTLFFLSGSAKAVLNDEEKPIATGDVLVVTPGTKHNVINTGTEVLKVYTVYTPPNHIDGRIHKTKADADNDVADEEVGHQA
jgi:mannose-6-phosphate isomerase-like protein (cupin superfamily)